MNIYWLEQTESDLPGGNNWLSPGEAAQLSAMRFPKRRTDWRLGRWTAKLAVAACLKGQLPLAEIEIRTAPSGAPEVFNRDDRSPIEISLSHRAGVACCAVTKSSAALGCDLELVEPRSRAFAADYFTLEEQELIALAALPLQPLLVTLFWSVKESALKALQIGLRASTRSVAVNASAVSELLPSDTNIWQALRIRHSGRDLHGRWRSSGGLVRTVVAIPRATLA